MKSLFTTNIAELTDWAATFSDTAQGVTRLLYSPMWHRAQVALKQKMARAGLHSYFDGVGNLFGRLEGEEKDVILTGSHIDTVKNGGKYDGTYGVLASYIAVTRLAEQFGKPKKTIEVVSLCEEEGSRFPLAYWGSKNVVGTPPPINIYKAYDQDGVSLAEAMRHYGFSNDDLAARTDIAHFVEVHVEQGIVLEQSKAQIGIVEHIVGQRRYYVTLKGQSNHAGATPMHLRHDPVVGAANVIAALTAAAEGVDDLRCTVGQMDVLPNVPNVIAEQVTFSLDIRHYDCDVLDAFCTDMYEMIAIQAAKAELLYTVKKWVDDDPVALDTSLHEAIEQFSEAQHWQTMKMVSGAGHDAQIFATYCPTTLFFVPSYQGISHSPLEHTDVTDLENGIQLLMHLLYKLAYEEENV